MTKTQKRKIKNILITFGISMSQFGISLKWLNQYQEHNFYTDARNLATIHGEQGLATIYGLFGLSFIFLVYGVYQILMFKK